MSISMIPTEESLACAWPAADDRDRRTTLEAVRTRLASIATHGDPDQSLMAAILSDALHAIAGGGGTAALLDGVWAWLESPGADEGFSFEHVCHVLALDVASLREALRVQPRPSRPIPRSTVLHDVRILNTIRGELLVAQADGLVGPESSAGRELAQLIGHSVARQRAALGLDHQGLAERCGLSVSALQSIESGAALPGLRILWRLAAGLHVPFGLLLDPNVSANSGEPTYDLLRRDQGHTVSTPGGMRSRALQAGPSARRREMYEIALRPYAVETAEPHAPETTEHIVVTAGTLRITVGERTVDLNPGDSFIFPADRAHRYENPFAAEAQALLIMRYA